MKLPHTPPSPRRFLAGAVSSLLLTTLIASADPSKPVDVVVYGGTSGGVAAAIQVKRMGKSVVLIEPTKRLGGLTTGGLGQTDIGNKAAIGGISREFYQRVRKHYDQPSAWKWEKREEYKDSGQTRTAAEEPTMWTFEPSAALKIVNDMIRDAGVEVIYGERLNRESGVKKTDAQIQTITMESGRAFSGRMFIDASYEGDLMAAAGVKYTVGREANAQYGETLNGVQTANAKHHNLKAGVDPYVRKGDPSSGLLPHIDPAGPGEEGAADKRVQAYCFRMCLTDHPENRIPFAKPEGYNESWYELMFRNFEAGESGMPWINSSMPNRKTDTNNRAGFSTDFLGQNYAYPEASYAEREKIVAQHRLYQQGLMWALANHPRVPEKIRKEISRWGMSKDEFTEGAGWQEQLYIREARRMVGEYVMTQANCQGREKVEDSIGLAAYTMDSHNTQRYVTAEGHARNEGDVQVGGFPPYAISYRSLIPKAAEGTNLFAPLALSASHIAFGSIRMEPVFMVLGQSAATAACQAIDSGATVQKVDYAKLRERLLQDHQVLEYTGPFHTRTGRDPKSLAGIVVDDANAKLTGEWSDSTASKTFIGAGYQHDGDAKDGKASARFEAKLPKAGRYEVRLAYPPNGNRASNVNVEVQHAGGATIVKVDQKKNPPVEGLFLSLGTFEFSEAAPAAVTLSNAGANGFVTIDAVQWLPAPAAK